MNARTRWIAIAVLLAVGLGYGAGAVSAKKPPNDGTLRIIPVEEIIGVDYTVEVTQDGVFAVLRGPPQGRDIRLLIDGGRGLVNRGVIAHGDDVFVAARDKKHKHRGHVTILK